MIVYYMKYKHLNILSDMIEANGHVITEELVSEREYYKKH